MREFFHPGQKVLFQHHPCTGGAEVVSALQDMYGLYYVAINQPGPKENLTAVLAALAPGLGPQIVSAHTDPVGPLAAHIAVLTFLRDPVERILSEQYFAQHHAAVTGHPAPPILPPRNPDHPLNCIGRNRYLHWACRLAGVEVNAETEVISPVLAMARAVIERGYAMVGITEKFDQSIQLLAKILNWQRVPKTVPQPHAQSGRPKTNEVDPEIVAWAHEETRYDQILYQAALTRFEHDVSGARVIEGE
ncbi:MAG: hypothetical protein EXR11_04175 [Rhodospirillaceae bacterium]|nr:hypothetical protein [Rhodospirillaceae bacterium]